MARSYWHLSLALALLVIPTSVYAHPIDELAQASYVGITPTAITVELDLIPGEEVSAAFAREVKKPGYPQNIGSALRLSLDGTPIRLQTVRAEKRELGERLFFRAALPKIPAGAHLLRFENTYAPFKSGYLASTLAGNEQITIGQQHRDPKQQTLTLDFQVRYRSNYSRGWLLTARLGLFLSTLTVIVLLVRKHAAGQ